MTDKKFCNTTCADILNKSNKIDQFVDELSFDMLIILSKMAGITFDHPRYWFGDQWPDKEGDLRVQLAERLTEIGGQL